MSLSFTYSLFTFLMRLPLYCSEENEAKLLTITASIEESERSAGETEILDGMFRKARFLATTSNFPAALLAYDEILNKKKISTGKKIDALMEKCRIALYDMNGSQLKTFIAEAKTLVEAGGDWDRRNRLKVYEALYNLTIREFKKAAALFLDCIATFNCPELLSYDHFMFFAVVTNIMSLDRITLHKKIIANPEVISILSHMAQVKALLHTLYHCDYEGFFRAISTLSAQISTDRYIGPHATFIYREYRILAYAQFLEAYKRYCFLQFYMPFSILRFLSLMYFILMLIVLYIFPYYIV